MSMFLIALQVEAQRTFNRLRAAWTERAKGFSDYAAGDFLNDGKTPFNPQWTVSDPGNFSEIPDGPYVPGFDHAVEHVCGVGDDDYWQGAPGDIHICRVCNTPWVALDHGPLDIRWVRADGQPAPKPSSESQPASAPGVGVPEEGCVLPRSAPSSGQPFLDAGLVTAAANQLQIAVCDIGQYNSRRKYVKELVGELRDLATRLDPK